MTGTPRKPREPWPVAKLGDVVRNVTETERAPLEAKLERYLGLEHVEPGNLHIRQWGDLTQDEVSFTRRFRGQVLFAKRRAYQRKVAVAEFDGVCSFDILCFEPKDPKVLLPELLPFICQTDAFLDLGATGLTAGPSARLARGNARSQATLSHDFLPSLRLSAVLPLAVAFVPFL